MSFIYSAFDKTPHISFYCKQKVPVQYRQYKYGLLFCTETNTNTLSLWNCVLVYIWRARGHSNIKPQCKQNRASVEASYSDSWVPRNTYFLSPPLTQCIEYFKDFWWSIMNCINFPKAFPVIIVSDDLLKGGFGCYLQSRSPKPLK